LEHDAVKLFERDVSKGVGILKFEGAAFGSVAIVSLDAEADAVVVASA
jgi:hypothetical protein